MFPKDTHILVIDDMSSMRMLVSKALRDLGFKDLTEAADGEEAWQKIMEHEKNHQKFQLIVSDWNMPKMKGIDLLKKVRETPAVSQTPFILLTAEAERDQVSTAVQAGVSGYLLKPFTKEQLFTVMSVIFSKKKTAA